MTPEHSLRASNEGDITSGVFDSDDDGRPDIDIGSTDYPGTRGLLYHQVDGGHIRVRLDRGRDGRDLMARPEKKQHAPVQTLVAPVGGDHGEPDAEDHGAPQNNPMEPRARPGRRLETKDVEDTMSKLADDNAVPLDDLGELWAHFEETSAPNVVETALRQFDDEDEQRRLLTTWLAWELDYSRLFARRETIETDPLWELLEPEVYQVIGREGEKALQFIARSTAGRIRPVFHPKAALAAIVLWRNGRQPSIRREAEQLLCDSPLPDDATWMYRLARRMVAIGADRATDRPGLYQVAALQLGSRYWDIAAKLGAMYLVRRCDPTITTPDRPHIVAACDTAAETRHREERDWFLLMTEAAIGGSLRFPWLERPVGAAMRLSVGDEAQHERIRQFHQRRLYDADHARLDRLYGHLFDAAVARDSATRLWARRRLYDEIWFAVDDNPRRALRLAELWVMHEHPRRFVTFERRLLHALRQIEAKDDLGRIDELLVGLYVATYTIEPHALKLVHRVRDRIDWETNPVASPERLDLYLKVSDYDRAFRDLTFEIGDKTMELADKDAALRVRYFTEKRIDATRAIRFVRGLLQPFDWLGSGNWTEDPLEEMTELGIDLLEARLSEIDLEQRVVDDYVDRGVQVADFEDISRIGADFVGDMVTGMRYRRVLVGAGSGLFAGGSSPLEIDGLTLSSVPVSLVASVDVCVRFCWYYGFDPREEPTLPLEIMAVALEGPKPAVRDRRELCRALAEFTLRTSFLTEAVGRRSFDRLVGRVLRNVLEQFSTDGYGDAFAEMVEWLVRRRRSPTQPQFGALRGAIFGAALEAALVNDVCESAEALLSDRFLARKYPDWERRIGWERDS